MAPPETEYRKHHGRQAEGLSHPSRRSRLLFPIILLLIVIGFYWKLTLTSQYYWVSGPDLAQQVLPFQVAPRE